MALDEYDSNSTFPGKIGRTVDESTPAWPRPTRAVPGTPNVLTIVLDDTGFGQTWVDYLVTHADRDLGPPVARWVRLAVGLTSDEYQLSNAELEAIERVRGGIRPDRDSYLVTWLAQVDQRPRAELLRDGVQALVWLRDFTR